MIPNKLRLHNFISYREEQTLDFSGIHLTCLTGDNGHGKSALLDAMTWALWGKARGRRDDELISLGETDMWVDLQFGLAGQDYRVWRQRSRKGRGQSDLHFYIWNPAAPEEDGWQLLDEGSLLERQAQITNTLRMDYETFTNSAFLLQGKADSFTIKTPSERKQILADILALDRYDQYEERAREEVRRCKEQAERLQGEIDGVERDLAMREQYEAQLEAARAAVQAAGQILRAAEAELAHSRLAVQRLQDQARQLENLRARVGRGVRDLEEAGAQLQVAERQLAEYESLVAQRAEIEAGWQAFQAAQREDADWSVRLLEHTGVQEQVAKVHLAISQISARLESEQLRLTCRAEDLSRLVARGEEQTQALAQVQQILGRLALKQARREAVAADLQKVAEAMAAVQGENEGLKGEGLAIRDKVTMLSVAEDAACPLCRQGLDTEHRAHVLADLDATRDQMLKRYAANQAELKRLASLKAELQEEDKELALELSARDARQRQAVQAETAVAEGQKAAEELGETRQQLARLAELLASPAGYAPAEHAEFLRLEGQLAAIGYDTAAHQAIRARLDVLRSFDARYQQQLVPALAGVVESRARVDVLKAQCDRRTAELAEDRVEAERLQAALTELPALEAVLQTAEAEVERAAHDERYARQQEGAALQQLNVLAALAARKDELLVEVEKANEGVSLYSQLREAFGKRGLQAMVIESAIPEIEIEANRLLARMSEGRMSLRLETQREKVTGGVAETLDIIISDELGPRAYEMYSGGEAFRANLALRIAISKLLARRAGAQLQTLVIDEGFGTQDAQGRGLLVEAINSIQHDFERLIVVTHIEELRDLFPVRIEVEKTANGSRATIV